MQTLLRKVGFEVEFAAPANPLPGIYRDLNRQGQPVTNAGFYRHSTGTHWDLKTDSSCGFEIASPIISDYAQLIQAVKITDIIKSNGGTVDARCGLHVHVDMNGIDSETFERVMRFMSRYENAFFLLADSSRQNNTYCRKLNGQDKAIKDGADFRSAWHAKHYWLNGTHLRGQGTLEFRLMASHLDAEYIAGWVLFLIHTVDYLIKGKTICWGKAKCASDRDLLQTMLGQAGFYGPFENRDKPTIVAARKWAISTYTTKVAQTDKRIKRLDMTQLEALVEAPLVQTPETQPAEPSRPSRPRRRRSPVSALIEAINSVRPTDPDAISALVDAHMAATQRPQPF
jgi:hypothetical protein